MSVTGTGAGTISMTGDGPPSFVDTNVLVYAFDKSGSPKKRVAQRLLNGLHAGIAGAFRHADQEGEPAVFEPGSAGGAGRLDGLAPDRGGLCGDPSCRWVGGARPAFILGCAGCGRGGAGRRERAVYRGFERWARDSWRPNQQSVRGVMDSLGHSSAASLPPQSSAGAAKRGGLRGRRRLRACPT